MVDKFKTTCAILCKRAVEIGTFWRAVFVWHDDNDGMFAWRMIPCLRNRLCGILTANVVAVNAYTS